MRKKILLTILLLGAAPASLLASCNTNNCAPSSCQNSCSSCSSGNNCCGCPCSGKTFFSVRPLYQSYRPELWSGFKNDRMIAAQDGFGGAFEAVVLGSQSTKNNQLAQYFLPNCKNFLTVAEDIIPCDYPILESDLQSQHFNIDTIDGTFTSTISFQASQSVVGVGFHYKQGFWFNDDRTRWWYIDASTSFQQVKNYMQLNEAIVNNGGGPNLAENPNAVGSMTEAFVQPAWNFGRIGSCPLYKNGLADIEFKLATEWIWSEYCHFAGYLGALIPTGNSPQAVNVFEPIVGHNKHWGVLIGMEGGFELWSNRNDTWHFSIEIAGNGLYLFGSHETRSFDLKGKPWSRYQEVYLNQAQAEEAYNLSLSANPADNAQAPYLNTPGINVFTQRVNVKPDFSYNASTVLLLANDCGFEIEVGYNLYARHAECVELVCDWPQGNDAPALKAAIGSGTTLPVRNITGNTLLECITPVPFADYTDSVIQLSDLDLESAAHPSYLSYLVHGALGYRWDNIAHPVHINAGGSYEFAERDFAVLNRWVAWGKLGVAF